MKIHLAVAFISLVPLSTRAADYDLVVYGGTSAGVIAAVQAKKMGKSVIIVCPDKHLGGLSSGGLGFTDTGNKAVIGVKGSVLDYDHSSGRANRNLQPLRRAGAAGRAAFARRGHEPVRLRAEHHRPRAAPPTSSTR